MISINLGTFPNLHNFIINGNTSPTNPTSPCYCPSTRPRSNQIIPLSICILGSRQIKTALSLIFTYKTCQLLISSSPSLNPSLTQFSQSHFNPSLPCPLIPFPEILRLYCTVSHGYICSSAAGICSR